jgi:hypothetical protein
MPRKRLHNDIQLFNPAHRRPAFHQNWPFYPHVLHIKGVQAIMKLSTRQKNIRQFFFREMVASHDARICKAGNGPMVLTWREAREFWRKATNGAFAHKR